MLSALKFVQRGVASRDFIPGLTHFRILNRRVVGYNGTIALSAPVDIGFDVAPKAEVFTRALTACEDVIEMKMHGEMNLLVKSGGFRIVVPCVDPETIPTITPSGVRIVPEIPLLEALEALQPFVGIDASRKWCLGILFAGGSAYATNNTILAEYWLGASFPGCVNVPSMAITEILRVGEPVESIQIGDRTVTFHYADGRWILSPILDLGWPNVPQVFSRAWVDLNLSPVNPTLVAACEKLRMFCTFDDMHLYFRPGEISTKSGGLASDGAVELIQGYPDRGRYHVSELMKVLNAADHIDLTSYPREVKFTAGPLRGLMLSVLNIDE